MPNNDDLSSVPIDCSDSKEGKEILKEYLGQLKKDGAGADIDIKSKCSSLYSVEGIDIKIEKEQQP